MSVNEREKATLQPKNKEEVQLESNPIDSFSGEILEHLATIRSYQGVLTDQFGKLTDKFETVSKEATDSMADRKVLLSKFKETLTLVDQSLKDLQQRMTQHTKKQEQELIQATKEVQQLKTDLLNGFLALNNNSKEPLSHKIYKVAAIAGSSVLGGLVVYLVLKLLGN